MAGEGSQTVVEEAPAPQPPEPSELLGSALLETFRHNVEGMVPANVENDLPEQKQNSQQVIDDINASAFNKLLNILDQSEKERLKQQRPLRNCLLWFIGLQMLVFNAVIGYIVFYVCKEIDLDVISKVLDFLIYYIGAVLVELIGMIWFITKSTFSSSSKEIIKGFLDRMKK